MLNFDDSEETRRIERKKKQKPRNIWADSRKGFLTSSVVYVFAATESERREGLHRKRGQAAGDHGPADQVNSHAQTFIDWSSDCMSVSFISTSASLASNCLKLHD